GMPPAFNLSQDQTLQFKPVTVFRSLSKPVAHSKSLTDGLIAQTFLNFFLCETRLLSLPAAPKNHRAPSSSTHICRLLVFKEHPHEAPCLRCVCCISSRETRL
ncbi:hypothetical protein, partial [Paraburkholderia diazotrophica]|uniref:hypothetical protein n=1 Tax=Paraburkholderia diazotrophica TaxID=667676 RepID=UPI00317204F1